ncbi:MAG: SpoIVB peptidase S55 domain-containing protein [Bacillota bacterium]
MKKVANITLIFLCLIVGTASFGCSQIAFASESVYIGGITVGIELEPDGVVVSKTEESNKIHKENGEEEILNFQDGDIIQKIGKTKVKDLESLRKAMKKAGAEVSVEFLRDGKSETTTVKTYHGEDGTKLGIHAREKIEGIGTITYIKQDGSFAGLGHPVSVWKNRTPAPIAGGEICSSMILGVNKGVRGKAGELKGVFIKDKTLNGEIAKNNGCGIFGKFQNKNWLNEESRLLETATKEEVQIGKAQILSTISGNSPQYYDCEIVSKDMGKNKTEKGMVIKITDERLLESTGGIVQGMSGSPIVQNDKLIGAVTHVFVADPTRGYGIFIDNMLDAE